MKIELEEDRKEEGRKQNLEYKNIIEANKEALDKNKAHQQKLTAKEEKMDIEEHK